MKRLFFGSLSILLLSTTILPAVTFTLLLSWAILPGLACLRGQLV